MEEETRKDSPAENPEQQAAGGNASAAASRLESGARRRLAETGLDREGPSLATAALVGVGVAVIEPELIPGLLIGAGAVLAPKVLPALGGMLRPLLKGAVKAGYSAATAAREMMAEASEQVEDIVAEARAEREAGNSAATAGQQAAPEQAHKRQRRAPRNPTPVPATNL